MKKIFLLSLVVVFLDGCSERIVRLAVMPDTQTYANEYPHVFRSQTEWIAAHADSIDFMLHEGDITHTGSDTEWQIAQESVCLLDGKVPYALVLGNHDGSDKFNKYFPYSKYSVMPTFGGAFEEGKMDNIWLKFTAGKQKWIVMALEFTPRNKVVDWANEVAQQHPDYKIIVLTHAYMYSDNTRLKTGNRGITPDMEQQTGDDGRNNGEMLWNKLVSRHANMMFVFSGHIVYHNGVGRLVSRGEHGNEVYQMLANYQKEVPGGNPDDGWLRIVTINLSRKYIDIKTYSPRLNRYRTEYDQQFKFYMR
ncbi:MAG: metallophosphoesterase [Tannerella sp.]|jgi:predicted phosphodiesterase|nr:metallophosphoesterase [Tannerella sp.]